MLLHHRVATHGIVHTGSALVLVTPVIECLPFFVSLAANMLAWLMAALFCVRAEHNGYLTNGSAACFQQQSQY